MSRDEEHAIEVAIVRPAKGTLTQADLSAHKTVPILHLLCNDSVEYVIDNGDQEIQQDDNVEEGTEEEDWPCPEGVEVNLIRLKASNADVILCSTTTQIFRYNNTKAYL